MIPVDRNGTEHWEDEEAAVKTELPEELLLRSTLHCIGDTYMMTAASVYVRGNYTMQIPMEPPLYMVRSATASLTLSIKTPTRLSRIGVRAMFQ